MAITMAPAACSFSGASDGKGHITPNAIECECLITDLIEVKTLAEIEESSPLVKLPWQRGFGEQ